MAVLILVGSLAALWLLIAGHGLLLPAISSAGLVMLLAFRFPWFAWVCYFTSVSLTGVIVEAGPALIRLELLTLPLLLVCVVRLRSRAMGVVHRRFGPFIIFLAIAYFFWATATTLLNAPTPMPSLWILIQIFTGFLAFYFLGVTDDDKLRMVNLGSLVLGSIAAVSLSSFVARTYLGLPPAMTPGVALDGRLIGFSFETNIFASQCVGWIALCSRNWPKLAKYARFSNCVLIVAVVLAGTRAAWVALLFVLFVLGLESARRSFKWVGWLILAVLLGFMVLPGVLTSEYADTNSLAWRLGNLFSTDVGTGAYRTGIYETAISDIDSLSRAFVGSGINSFSQFHLVDPTGVSASYLSSIWFATLYDTGFVGFSLFFGLLLAIVRYCTFKVDGIVVLTTLLICASATNLIWFQYPWVCLGLLRFRSGGSGKISPAKDPLLSYLSQASEHRRYAITK